MKIKRFEEVLNESLTDSEKVCTRTKEEIQNEITRIGNEDANFTDDSNGLDENGNMCYNIVYSQYATENTLKNFVSWLFGKD